MAPHLTVSCSISSELHAVVERMVASGRYGHLSEVFRVALRPLDERERGFRMLRDTPIATRSSTETLSA